MNPRPPPAAGRSISPDSSASMLEDQLAEHAQPGPRRPRLREHPPQPTTPVQLHVPNMEERSEAIGRPDLRWHDLRHTAVALAIANGAHPKSIQERMGHSSITVTLDRYGHLFPSLGAAVADGLEASYQASLVDASHHAAISQLGTAIGHD